MHCYAEYCPYGICDKYGAILLRFETRDERDKLVEDLNDLAAWDHAEGVAAPITYREAAKEYYMEDFKELIGGRPLAEPSLPGKLYDLRAYKGHNFVAVYRK